MLGLQALAKKKGGDKAEKAAAAAGLLLAGYCVARAVQRKFTRRPKVLVLHGKGMRGRGYERRDLFGDITLRQYNRRIRKWARWVGLDVTIYQSDSAEDLAHRIKEAEVNGAAAVVFNTAGFCREDTVLIDVIKESKIRVVEVHVTNPNMRGGPSTCGGSANCLVYGFGIHGYKLALEGVAEWLARTDGVADKFAPPAGL